MHDYKVEVSRDGRWWMIHVPEIDQLTQARRISEIEDVTSPAAKAHRLLLTRLAREGPVQPVRGYERRVRQLVRDASIAGIRTPLA